jgi:Holliday junction DNA helicase RuvA
MLEYIKGTLISKKPTDAVIEANGIGYNIHITLQAFESLTGAGSEVKIVTHLHIKDNPFALLLYGFTDENERECFRQIISVSGIGPRTAMSILSAIHYREFTELIAKGNYLPLTSIPGVGKKTAERLALELKDKLVKSVSEIPAAKINEGKFTEIGKMSEVISALISLGYNRLEADKMMRSVASSNGFMEMSIEEIIKEALRGKN